MTYASGGLIAATDYNTLAASINAIYSTGSGQSGYGQTALATVAATNTVTATQWSTLIGALNKTLAHQSGTAAIALPAAGNVVTYLAAVANGVTTATTNKALAATNGTTVTGTVYTGTAILASTTAASGEVGLAPQIRTVTFASADAARYFFNAGGKLRYVITGATNNDATSRSAGMAALFATNVGGVTNFGGTTNGGRTGTGGTLNVNNTALGFYNITSSPQVLTQVTSTTAAYTSDFVKIYASATSTAVIFYVNYNSGAHAFASSLNVTMSHRIDIVPPETTNLTNTWGTITVT